MNYQVVKKASKLSTQILGQLMESVEIGSDRADIDKLAGKLCQDAGVKPAFLGVRGSRGAYKHNMCIGVNDDVVHSVPHSYIFQEGDIVTLDFGIIYEGYYTDHCISFGLGNVNSEDQRLLNTGRLAVLSAAEMAAPGLTTGALAHKMQSIIELANFSVVKQYIGHGIGNSLHLPPEIPAHGQAHEGDLLKAGQTICIEAQVNAGTDQLSPQADGWTEKTADGENSVMFEYMVHLHKDQGEILTPTQSWELIKN